MWGLKVAKNGRNYSLSCRGVMSIEYLKPITRPCTCIMMDPDWTIAPENQAKSRIYGSARDDLPSYFHRHLRLESHRRGRQLDAAAFSAKAELCNEVELLRTYEELMLSQTAQSSLVNH